MDGFPSSSDGDPAPSDDGANIRHSPNKEPIKFCLPGIQNWDCEAASQFPSRIGSVFVGWPELSQKIHTHSF